MGWFAGTPPFFPLRRKWEQWANTHHVFPKGKGGRDTRLTE